MRNSRPCSTRSAIRRRTCSQAILLGAALGIWGAVAAADDQLPTAVSSAFLRAQIPETAIGLYVQRVGGGVAPALDDVAPRRVPGRPDGPLMSLQADQAFNPASTMKIVTTYAALELLGPAFTWKTVLASNAPQVGSSLEGDLVLRGAGDPKLVFEGLWLMLRQLRGRGIRTIKGDLVLDRSLFEPAAYDPAAFDGEPYKPYNVGPDALLVNFKSVTLRFVPDDTRREVRVSMEPALADVTVGSIAYADGPCGDWRSRALPDFTRGDRIAFAGTFPAECGEQTWNVAVLDHRQYVAALFRALWTELGGTIVGTVRDGSTPPDARTLVEHESPSLAEVVRDINKYSNNVMARELFLSMSAEVSKLPANVDRAQRVVRTFYAGKNLAMPELVLENGSGLSRRERISPLSMARVLQAAWASPIMPEFIASLPLVGFDGTMRRRLNQRSVAGQAHIKTGTLADARAVAGYVLAASGQYYVVVMLINHANAGRAQAGQDALLQWIYERG